MSAKRKALPPLETDEVYLVFDNCDCEDPGCYGKTDISVVRDPQLAAQLADQRSQRYGGHVGRPDMHWSRARIQTKLGEF